MKYQLITVDRYNARNSTATTIRGDTPELAWEWYWKNVFALEDYTLSNLRGEELQTAWETFSTQFGGEMKLRAGMHGLYGTDSDETSWIVIPIANDR
jgi:hypothetical protein